MRIIAVPLALATALSTSACAYVYETSAGDLTVPTAGRTIASVSQDAGLSLTAGAAPGTENGFFYDWGRRDIEQQIQAAQRRERVLQQQARVPEE